jgi:hypothetical protein
MLNPGGLATVHTVNIASQYARRKGASWEQITPPGHIFYFTPKSLRRYAIEAGLDVLQVDQDLPPPGIDTLIRIKNSIFGGSVTATPPQEAQSDSAGAAIAGLKTDSKLTLRRRIYQALERAYGAIVGKSDITVYLRKTGAT